MAKTERQRIEHAIKVIKSYKTERDPGVVALALLDIDGIDWSKYSSLKKELLEAYQGNLAFDDDEVKYFIKDYLPAFLK